MTTIYVHRCTKRYYDYGDPLSSERGIMFSVTGKACDASGFEDGTVDDWKTKAAKAVKASSVCIGDGEPVERRIDMNPHGLI